MNRWANNYYTQLSGRESEPPESDLLATNVPCDHPRGSNVARPESSDAVDLRVFRVVHLTQPTLKSLIERQGVRVLHIEQLPYMGAGYKSFLVTVHTKDASRLLTKNFWPGLVTCRPMQDEEQWENDLVTRRHTREFHLPTITENKSLLHGRRIIRGSGWQGTGQLSKSRTVQEVGSRPYSKQDAGERKGKANSKVNSSNTGTVKPRKNKELSKLQKEKLHTIVKNDPGKRRPITTALYEKSTKVSTRIHTVNVKSKNSDENDSKEDIAVITKQKKNRPIKKIIQSQVNQSIARNRRPVSRFNRNTSKNNKKIDNQETGDEKLTKVKLKKNSGQHTTINGKKELQILNSKQDKPIKKLREIQYRWITPLKGLLGLSSEKALLRLLGPDFDKLLTQYNVMDEELFLGVRVLAHCARAQVRPGKMQRLVYKICQPQVVFLINEFTKNVDGKYIARAERYFWDLGEFLDLYIVHKIFIHGMLGLFSTCLSKILALNNKKYVSSDLLKVYRGMQAEAMKNLP